MIDALVIGVAAFAVAVAAGSLLLVPRPGPGGLFFAVTVPPGFAEGATGRAAARGYRNAVLIHSGLALAGVLLAALAGHLAVGLAALGWQPVGCTWAYLAARRRVLPHAVATPAAPRRVALATAPAGSALAEALPFAFLAGVALALQARWGELPARVAIHWGPDGQPNGWATRSAASLLGPLVGGAVACAALVALRAGIAGAGRKLLHDPRGAAGYRLTQGALFGAEWIAALAFAASPLCMLGVPSAAITAVNLLAAAALGGYALVGGVRAGRLPAGSGGDNTPDAAWRLGGLVYVNREDPAVFVPKRAGIGYTVNLGHRTGRWVIALMLVAPLTIVLSVVVAGLLAR